MPDASLQSVSLSPEASELTRKACCQGSDKMTTSSQDGEIYSDGIGQSRQKVDRILRGLDKHETGTPPNERRSEPRYRCKGHPEIPVEISDAGSLVGKYGVVARNISSKGLGFLFGRLVDPGSRCTLLLETVDGKLEPVAGTVDRST